jgi:hypothetical protein
MKVTDEEIERLRRESPAYAGDEGWEEVPPPMDAVLSVRFDIPTMRRLLSIASATQRAPSALIRDWTLERLMLIGSEAGPAHAIGESPTIYATDNEQLRQAYRPDGVRWLLIGESSPASGRFFYRGDSNLFHAVRKAFEEAFGPMPAGAAFLDEFRRRGGWLVDVVDRPVNRLRGRPRADAVDAGIDRLAKTVEETRPELVVAVKSTLEGVVRRAAQQAGIPPERVHALPFPERQWRAGFVSGLAALLRADHVSQHPGRTQPETTTLHEAISAVLKDIGPAPARTIANEVNRRHLYSRGDGRSVDYQQILARAHKYPDLFRVSQGGIELISE